MRSLNYSLILSILLISGSLITINDAFGDRQYCDDFFIDLKNSSSQDLILEGMQYSKEGGVVKAQPIPLRKGVGLPSIFVGTQADGQSAWFQASVVDKDKKVLTTIDVYKNLCIYRGLKSPQLSGTFENRSGRGVTPTTKQTSCKEGIAEYHCNGGYPGRIEINVSGF